MGKVCQKLVYACLSSAMLCGCATITETVSNLIRGSEPPMAPDFAAVYFDGPRVRKGVALIVQVSTIAQQPVTMQVQVDQNGSIILPLLLREPVQCDGMTLDALKNKLTEAYSVYYKQPQVMVTFAPFDSRSGSVSPWGTVTVLGEVANPGPVNVPSTMDLTVTKVLRDAGGMRPFADKRNIQVTRCDKDGRQTKYIVNIDEIGKDGRIDKDMTLCSGDVVWVPETWY